MKYLNFLGNTVRTWTDAVAAALIAAMERIVSPTVVRLIEQDDGEFKVESSAKSEQAPLLTKLTGIGSASGLAATLAGKRAEIVLAPRRFLFRPLDLPGRAADFLDGIVRAQIDRLTPWTAADAIFGCSTPIPHGEDGITTIIAATTRKAVAPILDAVSGLHPASIALFAGAAQETASRIKVFEQKARGALDPLRLSRILRVALAGLAIAAALCGGAAWYFADSLGTQEAELARQIAQRRAAIRASGEGGPRTPLAGLERRKFETPASVIVLDALTQALPDHTFLTELHLAGNKVQIVGITRDAPSLIPLIEQSSHFTRATFFAPTTRAASDPGERFHIEARVESKNTVTP